MRRVRVIDANILLSHVLEEDDDEVAHLMEESDVHVPHVVDLEVSSAVRRLVAAGAVTEADGLSAVMALNQLPMQRYPHGGFLWRIFELRHNLTSYDASYVALAESLGAELVTRDGPLARAPGLSCEVHLLAQP